MIDSSLSRKLFSFLRQLSPSMLLFSVAIHGLVLCIPLSSYEEGKLQPQKNTVTQLKSRLPSIASIPNSTKLFSQDKTLVKQQNPINSLSANNPQFIAQLPSLPTGAVVQINENLPPIPTLETPQASPILNPIPKVAPTLVVGTTSKQKPAKPSQILSTKKLTPTSDSSKRSIIAVAKNADLSKKQDAKRKPKTITPIVTKPSQIPKSLQPIAEEQAFDSIFVKLDEEIGLNEELNFSQPEKFAMGKTTARGNMTHVPTDVQKVPAIKKIFGTALGKNPEELAALLQNQLETQGFKLSQIGTYASGLLYVVTKGKFTEYMTLTPNQEATGTIIVTWSNPPREGRGEKEKGLQLLTQIVGYSTISSEISPKKLYLTAFSTSLSRREV